MSAAFSLHRLLTRFLQKKPDAPMLMNGERTISYQDFDTEVERTVAWLSGQGIGAGDKIGVWLLNRPEWLTLLFAAERLGAIVVAINSRYRSSELQYILERSAAKLLLMQLHPLVDFPAVLSGLDCVQLPDLERFVLMDDPTEVGAAALAQQLGRPVQAFRLPTAARHAGQNTARGQKPSQHLINPDRTLILFTTSGTTQGPKLVCHTPTTLAVHSQAVAAAYGLDAPDARLLAAVPLCGVYGLNAALGAIAGGALIVLLDWFDAARAAQLLRQQRITHCFGSDDMYRRIGQAVSDDCPFPAARVFGFAAFGSDTTAFALPLIKRGFPLLGLYGSSEVQALFSLQKPMLPLEERIKGGGYPAHAEQVQVRARHPQTGEVCPPNVRGELEIKSSASFTAYLNNPEATKAAFTTDGFFKTGDLGYTREDGSFVYQARLGDALRLGGFLVEPAEIERALMQEDGIDAAQVVGVQYQQQTRAAAFVIARAGVDLENVRLALCAKLAAFKVPLRIWAVTEFPITDGANGAKVQRAKLRQMAQEMLAA